MNRVDGEIDYLEIASMSDEIEKYLNDPLWPILVETVHSMPMYRYHKAYVAEKMLNELPQLTPRKLAVKLGIPLGEALVILYEIKMGI